MLTEVLITLGVIVVMATLLFWVDYTLPKDKKK